MGGLIGRRPGRAAVLAAACLAVALSSGCTGSGTPTTSTKPAESRSESRSGSNYPEPTGSSTPPVQRAEHIDGETVTKAPQIVDGEPIATVADARGNGVVPLDGGVRPGPVTIAVNCQGAGTLTVELKPVGLSFPLECVDGEVSSTYNQIALKKARENAVLQVTAGSGVHWALTVGQ